MKALILGNRVVDISENVFPVSSDLRWVNCADTVQIGDVFDGENFFGSSKDKKKRS